jgi:c-di-GMP-binding flagellar brake protein YcgR
MSVSTKLSLNPSTNRRTTARPVSVPAKTPARTPQSPLPANLTAGALAEFKDRRRRRRVPVAPMYTAVTVRALARRGEPMEGHVLNLSETGMSVQLDDMLPVGQPLAVEFTVAGLGLFRNDTWPTFSLAAEVIRIDDLDDFPMGPYKIALRFERVPTIVQAQIARFIMNTPGKSA